MTYSEHLTQRERDILTLIGRGSKNVAVANALGLSERTVANRLMGIYKKFDLHSRAELGVLAMRFGLLNDESHDATVVGGVAK